MSTMLLSIKPKYAQLIIDGSKQFEFRTRRCRDDITKIIFYSTIPGSSCRFSFNHLGENKACRWNFQKLF